ncbi:MAG TPA: hypothetical protein VK021_12915 [Flavobacteriaceae bacterium]|nr:hypothetical protein [Flavobacteriaceae bacterium]
MTTGLIHLHSLLAYLVLLILIIAVVNAIVGLIGKRTFADRDLRISLFALILSHIQLLIGIVVFFISPLVHWFQKNSDVSQIMGDSDLRLYNLEHPLMMIIGIILITIGFSKHKKAGSSSKKFRTILIFYGIGLILILSRIPWDAWF